MTTGLDPRALEAAFEAYMGAPYNFFADRRANTRNSIEVCVSTYLSALPTPDAGDVGELVERLEAIDEAAMYERPATSRAAVEEATTALTAQASRIKELEEFRDYFGPLHEQAYREQESRADRAEALLEQAKAALESAKGFIDEHHEPAPDHEYGLKVKIDATLTEISSKGGSDAAD